jgi:hypothetical protein
MRMLTRQNIENILGTLFDFVRKFENDAGIVPYYNPKTRKCEDMEQPNTYTADQYFAVIDALIVPFSDRAKQYISDYLNGDTHLVTDDAEFLIENPNTGEPENIAIVDEDMVYYYVDCTDYESFVELLYWTHYEDFQKTL